MTDVYQLPVVDSSASVVELADGTRRYRKQLVKFGSYVNPNDPGKKMELNASWAQKVINNFKKNITHVPVVEGHPKDSAELVRQTVGDLEALSVEGDGLYGEFNIKDAATAERIDKGLVKDDSVSFHPDYQDKRTGDYLGPLLRHVGLVNDPYITGMKPFQALSDDVKVIMLSESKESTVSKLKNDKEFAVKVTVDGKEVELQPGAEVEVPEAELEAATKQVAEAVKPEPTDEEKAAKAAADKEAADKEAADKKAAEDKAAADKAAAEKSLSDADKLRIELSETKAKLAARDAEDGFNTLLKDGKVVPAQKTAYLSLATASTDTVNLSDGSTKPLSTMLTELLSAGPKRISFSEDGRPEGDVTPFDKLSDGEKKATLDMGITADEYNKNNSSSNKSESKKDDDEE